MRMFSPCSRPLSRRQAIAWNRVKKGALAAAALGSPGIRLSWGLDPSTHLTTALPVPSIRESWLTLRKTWTVRIQDEPSR